MKLASRLVAAAGRETLRLVPAVALRRARAAARRRDLEAAARHYAAFLRVRPEAVAAWIQLGHVLKESGDAAGAERAYRQAASVAPHHAGAHRELGRLFERQGRRELACEAFLRGLAVSPGATDLQAALIANGKRLQDLDDLLRVAALQVGHASPAERRRGRAVPIRARAVLHAAAGRAHERAARWPAAKRRYELSLAADPNQPELHLRLGRALLARGDAAGAAAAFRRCIAWSPHCAPAHAALGQGLAGLGDAAGAEAAFAAAVRLAPGSAAGREGLLLAGWSEDRIRATVAGAWSAAPARGGVRGPRDAAWRTPAQAYTIPAFLLRRPEGAAADWRLTEPDLADPASQLCTAEQMASPAYAALCARLGLDPSARHRKCWEHAFIYAALQTAGCLEPGRSGLGFGTGREPLPSAFASLGVHVTATDAPAGVAGAELWSTSAQRTQTAEPLFRAALVSRAAFDAHVAFRPADMNAIPSDLRGYDFCWSACCLEHLGSLRHGMDFIAASLATLRPGGVAVHTTEFNLTSNDQTFESPGLSLFRKADIELVAAELTAAGHRVRPLNFWPGATPLDEHVDLPPFGEPHLKLQMAGYVTTSIGLVVRKHA